MTPQISSETTLSQPGVDHSFSGRFTPESWISKNGLNICGLIVAVQVSVATRASYEAPYLFRDRRRGSCVGAGIICPFQPWDTFLDVIYRYGPPDQLDRVQGRVVDTAAHASGPSSNLSGQVPT